MSEEKIDLRTKEGREMKAQGLSGVEVPSNGHVEAGPEGRRVSRENRKPFGTSTQKLAFPDREGYHRHWFNETPGRIQQALDAGYTHVIDAATQKPVTRIVGVTAQGGALSGYLMEIPQEWFLEDMAANEKVNQEKEDTIRRGQVEAADPRERDSRFTNTAQGRKIDIRSTMARR
jgi:hypothetical protein